MQLCSSCFRDATLLEETEETKVNGFRYHFKSREGVQTRFYCCGRIPPKGFYKKRHGMFQNKHLNKDGSIELGVEAFEYESLSCDKSPTVPYVEDIPCELYQGRAIEIHAKLLENANRFSINLSTGKDNQADLALHFNPRFDRRIIIRNHRIKGKWGVEEIVSLQLFPFKLGKNFSVLIFVADEQFLIAINKIHYCAFAFRLPVEKIKSLIILGDIALGFVQHCERTYYPPRIFKKIPTVIVPYILKNEGIKCDIRRKIKSIKVGTKIDIFGRLKLLPRAFYVNLQKGTALWPHPIIPFHMNMRFHSPGTQKREKEIIFNSWSNGIWGKEEIISFCPFLPGTAFHLKLICTSNGYTVLVNDKILFNYESQDKNNIDSVVIHGDVIINKVVIH